MWMTDDNGFLIFLERELPLVLTVVWEIKTAGDTCKRALDIEFEPRLVSWFIGTTLGDGKKKSIFLVSGIFLGKADSVILLGFECTIYINP